MNPAGVRHVPYRHGTSAPRTGSKLSRKCSVCEAPIGHSCIKWKVQDGVRWADGRLKVPHKER